MNPVLTTTTVRSSDSNAKIGDVVQLRATTTTVAAPAGAGTPGGQVEFKLTAGADTIVIGTMATGANGVTVYAWAPQPDQVGRWTLTATYLGDGNFAPSSGSSSNQRVR